MTILYTGCPKSRSRRAVPHLGKTVNRRGKTRQNHLAWAVSEPPGGSTNSGVSLAVLLLLTGQRESQLMRAKNMTVPSTRRCTRVQVRLLAEMQVQGEKRAVCHDGQVTELSDRGAFIDVQGGYPPDSTVMLQLGSPLVDDIICVGVVRDSLPDGISVEFLNLSDGERAQLREVVLRGGLSERALQPLAG